MDIVTILPAKILTIVDKLSEIWRISYIASEIAEILFVSG